jgi:hypothetical protein
MICQQRYQVHFSALLMFDSTLAALKPCSGDPQADNVYQYYKYLALCNTKKRRRTCWMQSAVVNHKISLLGRTPIQGVPYLSYVYALYVVCTEGLELLQVAFVPRADLAFEVDVDGADEHFPWQPVDTEDMRRESAAEHTEAQALWRSQHQSSSGFSWFG